MHLTALHALPSTVHRPGMQNFVLKEAGHDYGTVSLDPLLDLPSEHILIRRHYICRPCCTKHQVDFELR